MGGAEEGWIGEGWSGGLVAGVAGASAANGDDECGEEKDAEYDNCRDYDEEEGDSSTAAAILNFKIAVCWSVLWCRNESTFKLHILDIHFIIKTR